jgi:hypothetical protein
MNFLMGEDMIMAKSYKNEIFAAIHETAEALHG